MPQFPNGVLPQSPNGDPKKKDKKKNPKKVSERRSRSGSREDLLSTEWDIKAAGRLREALVLHDNDLVSNPKKRAVSPATLAKAITSLRTERGVAQADIKGMIDWLKIHLNDPYVPKMRKADDILTNWGRYRDAKLAVERDIAKVNGNDPLPSPQEAQRQKIMRTVFFQFQTEWEKEGENPYERQASQGEVDDKLQKMGLPAGHVKWWELRLHL